MPRAAKLKVYRTPIGFHDAYVAAPSKKAAIEAWGSGKDVFTRGEAEIVSDPSLTAEPLASPGKVIKRLRGTAAEQIAALPPDKPRRPGAGKKQASHPKNAKTRSAAKPASDPKTTPRPSRAALEAADVAVAKAKERQAGQRKALAEREAALAGERRALEKKQAEELARLGAKRDEAAATYDQAIRRWRG
jgi:hypothetical protein